MATDGGGIKLRSGKFGCVRYLCFLLLLLTTLAGAESPVPSDTNQLVLVVTDEWNAPVGRMATFTRKGDEWMSAGKSVPVSVGRSGLAWGLGLHTKVGNDRNKQEGDGCAPAGAFRMTHIFGFDKKLKTKDGLPWVDLDEQECVDDHRSLHYNQIVDPADVERDWKSSETMKIPIYRLGLVVAHNPERVAKAGSCIFIHRWGEVNEPTSGCTALDSRKLNALCEWLRRDDKPVLVQLPRTYYSKLKDEWNLPDIN